VERGAILLAVHTSESRVEDIRQVLATAGASDISTANWSE